jgi:hypothetical protein
MELQHHVALGTVAGEGGAGTMMDAEHMPA